MAAVSPETETQPGESNVKSALSKEKTSTYSQFITGANIKIYLTVICVISYQQVGEFSVHIQNQSIRGGTTTVNFANTKQKKDLNLAAIFNRSTLKKNNSNVTNAIMKLCNLSILIGTK